MYKGIIKEKKELKRKKKIVIISNIIVIVIALTLWIPVLSESLEVLATQ